MYTKKQSLFQFRKKNSNLIFLLLICLFVDLLIWLFGKCPFINKKGDRVSAANNVYN